MARKRILLIDDYAPFAASLCLALSGEYEVEVRPSGLEALASLEEPGYDAVLCDLRMPGMSGLEVYRAVRESHAAIAGRFVFITAGSVADEARAFIEQTGRPLLHKPFDLGLLGDTLAGLWKSYAET